MWEVVFYKWQRNMAVQKCHHGENGISKCLPLEIFVCSMLITKTRDIMAHDHIWPYAHTRNYGSKIVNIIDGVFSPRFRPSKSGIAGGMPLRAKLLSHRCQKLEKLENIFKNDHICA